MFLTTVWQRHFIIPYLTAWKASSEKWEPKIVRYLKIPPEKFFPAWDLVPSISFLCFYFFPRPTGGRTEETEETEERGRNIKTFPICFLISRRKKGPQEFLSQLFSLSLSLSLSPEANFSAILCPPPLPPPPSLLGIFFLLSVWFSLLWFVPNPSPPPSRNEQAGSSIWGIYALRMCEVVCECACVCVCVCLSPHGTLSSSGFWAVKGWRWGGGVGSLG